MLRRLPSRAALRSAKMQETSRKINSIIAHGVDCPLEGAGGGGECRVRQGEERRGDDVVLKRKKIFTDVVVLDHSIFPLIRKFASVNRLSAPPVTHRRVAALAHESRNHAANQIKSNHLARVGFDSQAGHAGTKKKVQTDRQVVSHAGMVSIHHIRCTHTMSPQKYTQSTRRRGT